MSTTVTYKGETLTTVSNETVVLETEGTWVEDDFTLTDVTSGGTLQAKSNIDPTTSSQTIEPDEGYDGLSSVQINAMPTGTAGTPTATKGAVSNHSISVTPSVTNSAGYIASGTINGTAVTVSASELDSGAKSITANGNSQDVVGYASVNVNVPNTYAAGDEGKVVSSGALVAQTAHADVTPTTSDQTIDTTTNNSIKVKGDANLVAGNIKKDVEIFGTTGSYEGGGSTQAVTNIAGANVSLITGFLASDASISTPNATNKEVTTDYIDISAYQNKKLYILLEIPSSKPWIGIMFFNSSKTKINSRITGDTGASGYTGYACEQRYNTYTLCASPILTVPSNAVYIRFSFRTFGAAKALLVAYDDFDPADYFATRDIQHISFVNPIESDGTAT